MALYRSPQFGVEPYQESQGAQEPPSPVELQAFYEIQRRESQQKRLTKRKSGGPTALWARKSLKRSPTAPSAPYVTGSSPPSQPTPSPQHFRSLSQDTARHAQHFDKEKLEDQKETFSQMNHSASVVPDNDMPAWYNKDVWASVPSPVYKASYRLHNPVGPRWYRNWHLIPPSQLRPAARPPSVFSPSFPPMGTTSMPERSLDSRMAGPSRTPSNSPLPTPSSSQTRVADAAQKPRSRKPSLTTPDGIELDITDPWGATWHNSSPYDFGISPISTVGTTASENLASSRPRRASMTGFQIKRKAAPSPLSQSTSAVHLHPLTGPNVLRKLSKRKTATLGAIFGRSSEDKRNAVSLPVTPVDGPNTTYADPHDASVAHHELSASAVSSSSASIMTKTSKKEKRGSVLGRLAKKFSILKKSSGDTESIATKEDWHHVSLEGPKYNPTIQPPLTVAEPASIGDVNNDLSPPLNEPVPHVSQDADRSSSISLEVPFATGRLTVVNPDLPSNENTPIGPQLSLPPEQPDQLAKPEPSPMLNNADALHENSIQPSPELLSRSVLRTLAYDAQSSQPAEPVIVPAPPEQTSYNDIDVEESLPPTPPAKSRAPSPTLPPPILSPEIILQDTPRNAQPPVSSSHDSSTIIARQVIGQVPSASSGTPFQGLSQPDIPLTLNDDSVLVLPRGRFSYADSFTDSPMSTSSLDVGPPTPHNPVVPIPTPPRSHLPHPLMNEISSPPISTRQSTKKTETFKLVRGAPGRVIGSTDTIVAAGQQWEVVETTSKARIDEQKGGRRKSPETHHETGEERVNREQERQRVRESEKLVTSEARMREHHRDKERRHELSHEDKEKRKEWSRDEREEKRHQAERERERQKEHEREREAEKERERLRQQKEWERERERQRQKDLEREREKERQREREKEKERERQKEKERERERQKERERERQNERERQKEQERERERQKEQERERERQWENERRQKEREKEREREKARQKEQEEREREQRHREKRDRDRERRDQERRSRHSEEVQRHRTSSQSHVHHKHEAREGSTFMLHPEMSISEARHGHQRSDEQEGHRIRWPERRDGELPPVPTQSTTRPPLQRNRNSSSASTRPTSELPSAAELMALRAKEAYEMERLFKARSMYGQEPETTTPNSIPSNLSDKGSTAGPGTVYGSNHTYVFHPSSQNPRYHSSQSREALHPDRPYSYLSDLGTIPSLDSPTNRPISNPLPDPPRQSTYQPTPLAILGSNSPQTPDYWTKYTITTAH
ncbi:hypothetical protein JOM56_006432 [Amanita muscaria]